MNGRHRSGGSKTPRRPWLIALAAPVAALAIFTYLHRVGADAVESVMRQPPTRPPPEGRVDVAPFLEAGCKKDPAGLDCTGVKAIRDLGCDSVVWVDDELFALSPALPIALCTSTGSWSSDGAPATVIRTAGCFRPHWIRYLVWREGAFSVIASAADFLRTFAPVDSPAEARAFLVALLGAGVLRDARPDPQQRALVEHAEPSFAIPDGDGFRVRVFETEACGCSHHPTAAVEYRVSRTGDFKELSRQDILESRVEVCID